MTIPAAEEFGLRAGDTVIRVDMVMESVGEREPDYHEIGEGGTLKLLRIGRVTFKAKVGASFASSLRGAGACEHLTMVTLSEHFRRRRRE